MIPMYKLDDYLVPWIKEFTDYVNNLKVNNEDHETITFKIMYEASTEIYLSILQPHTTRTIKAILTRTLIECYADVFAVFRNDNPSKQAKKYTKYALKLTKLFRRQSEDYTAARDLGKVTTRPFALARAYQSSWNGMNVTSRVEHIDKGRHVIGYYEFFSLFAHVNPSRQVYLAHFNEPVIANYYSYIMLLILQTFVSHDFISEGHFTSLNKIAAEYSAEYIKTDSAPKFPDA